jgi:hypothetical protein
MLSGLRSLLDTFQYMFNAIAHFFKSLFGGGK